jgi:hypothetical protein
MHPVHGLRDDTGPMSTEPVPDLLASIQAGALDPTSDLTTVLRQCLALGGETGSARLREWASRELKGYDHEDDLPPYRETRAILFLDGFTGAGQIRRQMVSASFLPIEAQDLLDRPIELREPLAALIHMSDGAREVEPHTVNIVPPGAPQIIALMNHRFLEDDQRATSFGGRPSQTIERIYWALPLSTFTGITDSVRTILVELVAEMRARLPKGEVLPSAELADQAVSIAVYGDHNQVVLAQAGPGGTARAKGKTVSLSGSPEGRAKRIAWWVFGILASASAITGIIVFFH